MSSIGSKIKSHLPHQELSVKFWDEDKKLKPELREQLLRIANSFIDYLGINIDVVDITFTGSYANYNYTPFSDVDLHVIIDTKSINKDIDLVEEFLKVKRQYWNDKHDIKIQNIDVELYPQDIKEEHRSSGVYSISNDEWIVEPKKLLGKFDQRNVLKKVQSIKKLVDIAIDNSKEKRNNLDISNLLEKIRKMRKSALEKGGEMSDENIVYKILREEGDIQKLYDMKDNIFDIDLSL